MREKEHRKKNTFGIPYFTCVDPVQDNYLFVKGQNIEHDDRTQIKRIPGCDMDSVG